MPSSSAGLCSSSSSPKPTAITPLQPRPRRATGPGIAPCWPLCTCTVAEVLADGRAGVEVVVVAAQDQVDLLHLLPELDVVRHPAVHRPHRHCPVLATLYLYRRHWAGQRAKGSPDDGKARRDGRGGAHAGGRGGREREHGVEPAERGDGGVPGAGGGGPREAGRAPDVSGGTAGLAFPRPSLREDLAKAVLCAEPKGARGLTGGLLPPAPPPPPPPPSPPPPPRPARAPGRGGCGRRAPRASQGRGRGRRGTSS